MIASCPQCFVRYGRRGRGGLIVQTPLACALRSSTIRCPAQTQAVGNLYSPSCTFLQLASVSACQTRPWAQFFCSPASISSDESQQGLRIRLFRCPDHIHCCDSSSAYLCNICISFRIKHTRHTLDMRPDYILRLATLCSYSVPPVGSAAA